VKAGGVLGLGVAHALWAPIPLVARSIWATAILFDADASVAQFLLLRQKNARRTWRRTRPIGTATSARQRRTKRGSGVSRGAAYISRYIPSVAFY
jgi:hypothetical protein